MGKYFVPTEGTESWRCLLADREKQWKTGYSAKELAETWEGADGFPKSVKALFKGSQPQIFNQLEFLYGFPEYKVSLKGRGASSQNDLYVLAKSNEELVTIMVEGKASEPFGEPVNKWLGTEPSDGQKIRLDYLLDVLELDKASVMDKRYQLLHRTASAIIEAEKVGADHALMLVHSFSKTSQWYYDYAAFVNLFNLSLEKNRIVGPVQINRKNLYFAWITENE
ncbi:MULTISPECIES: DUF6946 family protein [Bacillaceae]|uniref:DUF6946 domain-containing protein n=1 Tax=Evansella alkalicola TaxID=745819 RepID=A0ABS6K1N9_9BACI|nr:MULTISPECIES: hypothetical protein [Bacillaceae]MBU9723824.1 hypothetical protein [Bacillus alkalicola]